MKLFFTALCALGWLLIAPEASACDGHVDVGGRALWAQTAGEGALTVVFESGNGDNSSVWAALAPVVQQLGVRTFVYDRAGLGQSDPAPGSYLIDDEVVALQRALDACRVNGPIVIVAHSYGGFLAALLANGNEPVVGAVLVDANVPNYFDDDVTAAIVTEYTPQFSALEAAAPQLARVLIPIILGYPESARRVRAAGFAHDLPTIDIVAERSWGSTPEQDAAMREAHAAFVAASPAREGVFAAGSGHNVMRDRPDVVIDAITRMIAVVNAAPR